MVHYTAFVLVYVATVAYGLNDGLATSRDYVHGARTRVVRQNADALESPSTSNVESALNARQSRAMTGKMTIESFLSAVQPFEVISAYLDQLADLSPQATTKIIGQSSEGRDLKIIKIGVSAGKALQPVIMINAASHGNDTGTPAVAVYIANQLITSYKTDPTIKKLLDTFEVRIVPVVNPDGYHYARTVDPKWAKTRQVIQGSKCLGVNVNRNWDIHWGQNSSSTDPCNEQFAGKHPFSSISAHILSNYIYRFKAQVKLFVSIFGNGPAIDLPYGYTKKLPGNYKSLLAKAKIAAKAMAKPAGTVFKVGNTAVNYKPISGESADWTLDVAGVPYVYTIATRLIKRGSAGKVVASELKPDAVEVWSGVKALAGELLKEHLKDNLRNLNTGCRCSNIQPK